MNALTNIGALGSASLEVVAGPIGEALVATGLGIAVAVPAVLAFNFFTRRLKLINGDLDDFAADLIRLSRKANFASKQLDTSAAKHQLITHLLLLNSRMRHTHNGFFLYH